MNTIQIYSTIKTASIEDESGERSIRVDVLNFTGGKLVATIVGDGSPAPLSETFGAAMIDCADGRYSARDILARAEKGAKGWSLAA